MSISELNHFMTYVLEGWMLFSAGFISIGFVSFTARRIQEDIEAEALALSQSEGVSDSATETVAATTTQLVAQASAPQPPQPQAPPAVGTEEGGSSAEEAEDSARLEEVAAVSEQLAKNRGKQSDGSSVSVST